MSERTLKVSGRCVNHDRIFDATIVIDVISGLIIAVKEGFDIAADISIPQGGLIFPGFLDVHVHGREDITGQESYKENFLTLGEAAINGGVVHMAEMGNNPCPPICGDTYVEKELLTWRSRVPVTLYAMIGPNTHRMDRRVPYKLCLARTTGKSDLIFFPSRAEIEKVAPRYVGCHVSHHAEDQEILSLHRDEVLHELRRPAKAEDSAIDFALHLIENYFGEGKLCHCSVRTGIHKIIKAKRRGVKVTCEITPHHLYFDLSMVTDKNRPWMQMNPPLRTQDDRLFCINALREGGIDMLASDHAPHTPEDKMKEASGQPHLDTLGPFATWLMDEHDFRPQDIARICSYAPAQFLNKFLLQPYGCGYGRIGIGHVGSLTIIDPDAPITIRKEMLKTKCGWSPFEGVTFPGSVTHTIVKGQVLKSP